MYVEYVPVALFFFCFRLLLYLVYLVALYLIVTVYGE